MIWIAAALRMIVPDTLIAVGAILMTLWVCGGMLGNSRDSKVSK
jgi:hypothetical protein